MPERSSTTAEKCQQCEREIDKQETDKLLAFLTGPNGSGDRLPVHGKKGCTNIYE